MFGEIRCSKREDGTWRVEVPICGRVYVFTREEAAGLGHELFKATGETMGEKEQYWFFLAGSPGVVVGSEFNPPEIMQQNAWNYAQRHRAGIWAIPVARGIGPTGILAWPKVGDVAEE